MKLGYEPSYISSCLEQYESSYGTKQYAFKEIKAMIDRMANPPSNPVSRAPSSESDDSSAVTGNVTSSGISSVILICLMYTPYF